MFVGHLDTPLVRLANHEVVETDDHHVYEAGGDAAPGDPRRAGRVLSGGYLANFTRVPGWALLVSLGVLIGGVTLALTNRVFIEPEQPSYVAPSETKPMLVGSKWLGVCVLSLAGGALTIQESNPTHLSTFGFLLFTLSVVLGGLLLFYRTLALVAVAVAAIIGIAAAWTTLKTKCLGLCPPTAIETFVTTVIPSAIVCVLGYRARRSRRWFSGRDERPEIYRVAGLFRILAGVLLPHLQHELRCERNIRSCVSGHDDGRIDGRPELWHRFPAFDPPQDSDRRCCVQYYRPGGGQHLAIELPTVRKPPMALIDGLKGDVLTHTDRDQSPR